MVKATEHRLENPYKKGSLAEYTVPLYVARYTFRHRCPFSLNMNTYMGCDFECRYCYARGLQEAKHTKFGCIRTIDLKKFEDTVNRAIRGETNDRLSALIQMRIPIKLGVMSDAFQGYERQMKTSLGVLRILNKLQYPVLINTKGTPMLTEPGYFELVTSMPCIVQTSFTSWEDSLKLEPGAPSAKDRMAAVRKLVAAGVPQQVRLAPIMPLMIDQLYHIIDEAHVAGVSDILSLPIRISKETRPKIDAALGYNYIERTKEKGIKWVHETRRKNTLIPTGCWFSHIYREFDKYCKSKGMNFFPSPDYNGTLRNSKPWMSCCGVERYPGFENCMTWTFQKRGYKIGYHTTFDEYIRGSGCPYIADFKRKWERGEFHGLIPGLIWHPEDKTYSLYKMDKCGYVLHYDNGELAKDAKLPEEYEWSPSPK